MLNENEIRLNALVNELRAHVSDLSIRAATMAGELAVSQARMQLLEGQLKSLQQEKPDVAQSH